MSATKFSALFFGVFFGVLTFSGLVWAGTFEVQVQDGDRLVVKGLAAQVQFVAQPGAKSLRVTGVDDSSATGAYTLKKKDQTIEVRMNEFDSKKDWKESVAKTASYMRKIEIIGPATPVDLHLRDGSVTLQKWSKEANISLINGRVLSQNGSGSLQINLQKGDINVFDHIGKVSTDGYAGNSTIKNVQGDIDAQLFSGNLTVDKVRGALNLNAQQSSSKVTQSSGGIQFENGKGALSIQGYKGRIEGQTGDGALTVNFLGESELNIKSKSGRVNIQTPANSGASVNLLTIDGDIFVPKELSVIRLSSEKSVRGRLRGEAQKASIIVRSQEGSINVK